MSERRFEVVRGRIQVFRNRQGVQTKVSDIAEEDCDTGINLFLNPLPNNPEVLCLLKTLWAKESKHFPTMFCTPSKIKVIVLGDTGINLFFKPFTKQS